MWEGQLVVEGIPDYESFVDAVDYLRQNSEVWIRPIEFDKKLNLSYFYLLTDLNKYNPEKPMKGYFCTSDDTCKHCDYVRFVELLFNGVVELDKI